MYNHFTTYLNIELNLFLYNKNVKLSSFLLYFRFSIVNFDFKTDFQMDSNFNNQYREVPLPGREEVQTSLMVI